MKKLIFCTIVCLAFTTIGYSSNEVVNDIIEFNSPCEVSIQVWDGDRVIAIGTKVSEFKGTACASWALGVIQEYEKEFPSNKLTYEITAR